MPTPAPRPGDKTLTGSMIYKEREKAKGAAWKISFWTGDADGVSICKKWSGRIAAGTVNSLETISTRRFLEYPFPLVLLEGRSLCSCVDHDFRCASNSASPSRPALTARGWKYLKIFFRQVFPSGASPRHGKLSLCLRFPFKGAHQDFGRGAEARHINRRRLTPNESLAHGYIAPLVTTTRSPRCWNRFKN